MYVTYWKLSKNVSLYSLEEHIIYMWIQRRPFLAWPRSIGPVHPWCSIIHHMFRRITVGEGTTQCITVIITIRKSNKTHHFYNRWWKFCPPDQCIYCTFRMCYRVIPWKLLKSGGGLASFLFQGVGICFICFL